MNFSVKHLLLKYKYFIAIAIFAVIIGFVGDHCLVRRAAQKQEISQLESEIAASRKQFKRDQRQLEQLKKNSEAVKRVAHERYHMKTDDEDIFVVSDEE